MTSLGTPAVNRPVRMSIAGQWCEAAAGTTFPASDPATGAHLADVPDASRADVDQAVAAAADAARPWGRLAQRERTRLVLELAARLRAKAERFAWLEAVDAGIPLATARADVTRGIERLEYFATIAVELQGRTYPAEHERLIMTIPEPYGVIAVINPFNHPFMFALSKMAAPLAVGNAVVMKPPHQASLSSVELMRDVHEVLPAGVLNLVTGLGGAGAALAAHPGIGRISFTGSVPTGQAILAAAAKNVTPVVLELGGKNSNIVFPDADLPNAVKWAVSGMSLGVSGQSCQSGTRLFLHEDVHDIFLTQLADRLSQIRIGLPVEEKTQMGPLITAEHLARVRSYVDGAKADGARLVTGGDQPADAELAGGHFLRPTVFADVRPEMTVAREEIFGPVLSVIKWRDRDEMLAAVNGLPYGMTASVFSRSLDVLSTVRQIDAGYIYLNKHGGSDPGVPFGGWKHSGIGIEHSFEELLEYTRTRTVAGYLTTS
jgi:betaine-aldehyde dehydrogenase